MPVFLIETFGNAKLTLAFWGVVALETPLWLLMILWPQARWVVRLASPFFIPVIFNGVLFYFYYLAMTVGPPDLPQGFDFKQSKAFIAHPMVVLVLWCHVRILHLLLGTLILREANRMKLKMPFVLACTWLLGPVGWMVFVFRVKGLSLFKR